jgi:Tfp pilus assembly PilM family ATPase
MIVLERAGDRWKVVEAGVAAGGIVVRRARMLSHAGSKPGEAAEAFPSLNNRAQVILVAGSDRSVCRRIQAPAASDEDTRRMVALRLETELPYPVAESFWVCERLNGSANGESPVLVLAIPRAEVADAERALGFTGRHPWAVQLDAGALAELARASQQTPEETVAVCRIEERTTDLLILRHGRLEYARRIFAGLPAGCTEDLPAGRVEGLPAGLVAGLAAEPAAGLPAAASSATAAEREPESADGPAARLGDELDQCLHHYALDSQGGGIEPARLIVTGEGAGADDRIAQALGRRLNLPAGRFALPQGIQVIQEAAGGHGSPPEWLDVETFMQQYPACLGALIAAQRAIRGEDAAAPVLRRRKAPLLAALPRRRAVLAGLGAALFCALVALSFLVRTARYEAASRAVRQGLPFLQDMDRLQNEVDVLEHEKYLARHPMLDTMLALAETLPKGIQIATLSISSTGKIALSGVCNTVEDASEKAVGALKASKVFATPKFLGASKQAQAFTFRMTFELRNASAGGNSHESAGPEEAGAEAGK